MDLTIWNTCLDLQYFEGYFMVYACYRFMVSTIVYDEAFISVWLYVRLKVIRNIGKVKWSYRGKALIW